MGKENLASIFFGWLDLSRDILGYSKQSKIRGNVRVSWLGGSSSSANKVPPMNSDRMMNKQTQTFNFRVVADLILSGKF